MTGVPPPSAGFFFVFHFHREDGGIGLSPNYKALQSSSIPALEHHTS
jgi:hypothetical protein